jgi:26S proteasome regulatory subunit T5
LTGGVATSRFSCPTRPDSFEYSGVNFEELARSTEDFNGAMLKAVCVEAGMLAMRRDASCITHEDFVEGVAQVQMKKKQNLQYYA